MKESCLSASVDPAILISQRSNPNNQTLKK